VIVWRTPGPCPAALLGAEPLSCAPAGDAMAWGAGDPWRLHMGRPVEISPDLAVAWDGEPEPIRPGPWARPVAVADHRGRPWYAPAILTAAGDRDFAVAYGRDWLPALTPEQTRAEAIAQAARAAFIGAEGPSMPVCCQWAAELLCVTHHLTPEVVAALAILDDVLVVQVLAAATGLPLGVSDG
jgi:hypothetical protein